MDQYPHADVRIVDPADGSQAETVINPKARLTPTQRATMAASALPLMGRFADDDGPLKAAEPAPAPKPQGNRWQRRQAGRAQTRQIDPTDMRRKRTP